MTNNKNIRELSRRQYIHLRNCGMLFELYPQATGNPKVDIESHVSSKWDRRWFQLAELVASWSQDPSKKVGAVIIPKDSDVPITGWNGFPRKVRDLPERYDDRELKYRMVVHAEANAILNAAKNGINITGGTIYITYPPCNDCAKMIIQSGISKVIYMNADASPNWVEAFELSKLMFEESGVSCIDFQP